MSPRIVFLCKATIIPVSIPLTRPAHAHRSQETSVDVLREARQQEGKAAPPALSTPRERQAELGALHRQAHALSSSATFNLLADEAAELLGSAGASALQQAQEEAPSGPGGRGGGGVQEQLEHAQGEIEALRTAN